MKRNHFRICLWVLLTLCWTSSATATATMIVIDGGVSVPLSLVLISMMLSSLAGGTALALRIDKELRGAPGTPLIKPWLFCAAHMMGSWMAGTLAFMMGQGSGWDVWVKLAFVLSASFIGAKFIESVAEKLTGAVPVPGAKT